MKEALKLLKDVKVLWIELQGEAYYDCNGGQDFDKAISLLEARPEPGEFAKKIRQKYALAKKPQKRKPTHGPCCTCQDCGFDFDNCQCQDNDFIEACDKIDALEAINKHLTNENANWKQKCEKLQAEIKRIRPRADCYQRVCETLGIEKDILGHVNQLQAEIEKLKGYLKTYGRHTSKCKKTLETNNPAWIQNCSCGFSRAEKMLQGDTQMNRRDFMKALKG